MQFCAYNISKIDCFPFFPFLNGKYHFLSRLLRTTDIVHFLARSTVSFSITYAVLSNDRPSLSRSRSPPCSRAKRLPRLTCLLNFLTKTRLRFSRSRYTPRRCKIDRTRAATSLTITRYKIVLSRSRCFNEPPFFLMIFGTIVAKTSYVSV